MQEAIEVLTKYNAINDSFALPENYENAEKNGIFSERAGIFKIKLNLLELGI